MELILSPFTYCSPGRSISLLFLSPWKLKFPPPPLCPENDSAGIINSYLTAKSNEQFLVLIVFDLKPLTLLIIPSCIVSHHLLLWTHSSSWPHWSELPLHRIPFLCLSWVFLRAQSFVPFTLQTLSNDCIHISDTILTSADFQIFVLSHVTPPEFQLLISHAQWDILQISQTMHL